MNNGNLWLEYDGQSIGTIEAPFTSDFTWYGGLRLAMSISDPALKGTLQGYVVFDIDWNNRCETGTASYEERAVWRHIEESPLWTTKNGDGTTRPLTGAPGFFSSGEISWLYADEARPTG